MKDNIRILALTMALVACVGLFAACGGSKNEGESTPSDVTEEDGNAANSENSGKTEEDGSANGENAGTGDAVNGDSADENKTDSSETGDKAADELYVAEVTTLNDDGTLLLTLCTSAEGAAAEITDYANVDMAKYSLSSSTVNYTVPDDAIVSRAVDGALEDADIKDIAAGNRLLLYSQSGTSNIVIYPAA